MDVWQAIGVERAGLVEALAGLPEEQWSKPSLCAGWSVKDVVAHLLATAQLTPPSFFVKLASSGFSFDRFAEREVRRIAGTATPRDLVADLRARISSRTAPPGPSISWLGETIVHGEDVFRALGSYREHPQEHLTAVAGFYAGSNLLIGAKTRIAGVRLEASDATWTHGEGPVARGPLIALVLAMTGRARALDDLSGDGVAVLRSRG